MVNPASDAAPNPLLGFFALLPRYGIQLSMQYLLEFQAGLQKGLVHNIDELFVLLRLCVVKKVEQMDAFERAFAFYFLDVDIPDVAEGDPALFDTHQFQAWLREAIARKEIQGPLWKLDPDELIKKFWETIRQQLERHDGGRRWVGTGGASAFGHSGQAQPGVRVHAPMQGTGQRSAIKAIGARQYTDYAASHSLSGSNLRQALSLLKQLKPSGARTELDIDATIAATGRNGGEIELIFDKALRDKIKVILLIDNGGRSMLPHVPLTQLLFAKLSDRFGDLKTYFFHNTVYGQVFADPRHTRPVPTAKLLQAHPETRVIIIGDASMAPEELVSPYGSLYFEDEQPEPSIYWLQQLQARFKSTVWLNPIPRSHWDQTYGSWTLQRIRELLPMEELSLKGLRWAVERLNR
ncbi:MAG: hypothetical protein IGS03_18975 [Candidatus Sericytochromatia bacterium]|nr:hypothetical protein [Candidatus Sericytochromatia bacterium]